MIMPSALMQQSLAVGGHGMGNSGAPEASCPMAPARSQVLILVVHADVLVVEVLVVAALRRRRSVGLVVRLLGLLLALRALGPVRVGVLPRLVEAVGDDDVVEDRARIHRPELEADRRDVIV